MNEKILMLISDIINAKTDIALTVTEYDTYPVIKIVGQPYTVVQFTGQKLQYIIDDKCLNTILDIMDNLKKLGFEICICNNNITSLMITTIIIKKPTNWNTTINVTPIFMYTEEDIEPENVDNKYTGTIILNQTSETDIIIDFNDNDNIPVKIRLNTMLEEPAYGTIIVTDTTGYREIKLFEPQNINFDNLQRLKNYNYIVYLLTLIAKHM